MEYTAKLVLEYKDEQLSGEANGSVASIAFMLSLAMKQDPSLAMAAQIALNYVKFTEKDGVDGVGSEVELETKTEEV
jgi:hypothetical protein